MVEVRIMKNLTSYVFSFEGLIQGNYLYIDKTEYIWNLVQQSRAGYFLSRPRRFGKSLTVSTLKAFFEGKKDLFRGLAISRKDYDWRSYPVIHLSFGDYGSADGSPESLISYLKHKIRGQADAHQVTLTENSPGLMFADLVDALAKEQQVVILVDEYDKPILDNIASPEIAEIQKILKGFYSILKDRNAKERFLFVTGVTKFCHVSLFSDLNNLTDLTMRAEYATMFGYTQSELEQYFGDRIEAMAGHLKLLPEELRKRLKTWYDGYCFEENSEKVYNPVSIAKFFENGGKFLNYWFATGTPAFLMELAKKNDFNFEDAVSKPVPGVTFDAFEIPDIDPVTLLLQTGYLTIKSTELRFNRRYYWLDFPNEEVAEAFSTYLLNSYVGRNKREVSSFSVDLAMAFVENNLDRVRKILESFFAGIPYPIHKKSEATFQTIFYAVFRLLGYNIEAESCTNNGRIDAVVQTEKHIYLFEFKLDGDRSALSQIREKEYFKKFQLSGKAITLVGVTFDSDKGQISDWKTEEAPL